MAETAVETATTSGMASPRACGQVMTITVTMRDRAKTNSRWARKSQTNRVTTPTLMETMVSQKAARSARFCVRDLLSCACRTSSVICAR